MNAHSPRPARGCEATWWAYVHAAARALAADFPAHVAVTEGPAGLHQAILGGDLRRADAVDALTAEHCVIAAGVAALSDPVDIDPEAVRERANTVLGRLVRHRQRGADLVHEAFET